MRDANCIFCKIIGGEIPSNTIYEDDEFKVILDASPASKGHALILQRNIMQTFMRLMKRLQDMQCSLQKNLQNI